MKGRNLYRSIISDERKFPWSLLRFLLRILDNFFHDSCFIRASGLAFNTLLALVPLTAVIFAFGGLKSFSGNLQKFLMESLLPSTLNQILEAVTRFTENSARLGTYGLVFFLITILFLMNNIENNLNAIWHCPRKRSFFQQFTIYTTVIVFSSLLIGGNFSISGEILSILPHYTTAIKEPLLLNFLYRLSSVFFITLIFLLLIMLIPSTRVSIKSALTGALTGAVIWELAKWGFKSWAGNSVRNSVIYGSLFLIPLLLIWLYAVWLIIMIAMETAHVHQHRKEKHMRYNRELRLYESFDRALNLYLKIAGLYLDCEKRGTLELLAREFPLNEEEINQALLILQKENLVAKSEDGWYFPVVPPEKMAISQLFTRLGGMESGKEETISRFTAAGERELSGLTVSEFLREKNDSRD